MVRTSLYNSDFIMLGSVLFLFHFSSVVDSISIYFILRIDYCTVSKSAHQDPLCWKSRPEKGLKFVVPPKFILHFCTMASSAESVVTSSFLLTNLHCPSCVSSIETALFGLTPRPYSVSPSILTSWVTVRHERRQSLVTFQNVLTSAGFDIASITQDGITYDIPSTPFRSTYNPLDSYIERLRVNTRNTKTSARDIIQDRHIQECKQCQLELAEMLSVRHSSTTELTPAPTKSKPKTHGRYLEQENEQAQGSETSTGSFTGTTIDTLDSKKTWRATLAVGGMTCASCAKTISDQIQKIEWVEKISVNLIANSATIDFMDKSNARKLVDAIEDMGFDAVLDRVISLKTEDGVQKRKVELKVDGMFCSHCPGRLQESLSIFKDGVAIEKALTVQDPILKLSYIPHLPERSIRTIIETLNRTDERFSVSIHHPPTLEERTQKMHALERKRISARVILSVVAAIPTLIIGVVFMSLVSENNSARQYLMGSWTAGISRSQWALFIMATPVYFFAADVFHRRAIKEIFMLWRPASKTPFLQRLYRFGSMNMLMSLGTTVAYVSSVAQLIAAAAVKSHEPDDGSFYFDSVVFLTMFLLIGRLIEAYSKAKTGDAVSMLGKLRPTEALLIENDTESVSKSTSVFVDLLETGDSIRILHGASPPCDGTVLDGETSFDESSLTGESKLIKKKMGDEVFAGTINKGSPITICVTGVAGTSMLDQIVTAVREGQTKRAPIERIADTLTSYFVPFITLFAISTWIIWLTLGLTGSLPADYLDNGSNWVAWSLQFAIAVFVVACPCGLALAAPTAIFVGGGLAAQFGILVKGGGEAFEKASKLDCVVFDKTGTLTLGGAPSVTNHEFLAPELVTEDSLLGAVRGLEESSSHPVAKGIVSFCGEPAFANILDVEEIPGKGLKGKCDSGDSERESFGILIGNDALMADHQIAIATETGVALQEWKEQGKSVALCAINKSDTWQLALIMAISDQIRPEAVPVISALRKRGTEVWMLSGDNHTTATAVANQVGILSTNVISGVLPSQKSDAIQNLQKTLKKRDASGKENLERAIIAMVGDGINDSPALTTADVGIAIGSGSDIAISSAEFVLVSSNLESLLTLLDLSQTVFRRVKFNFAWALVYNMITVPVAAGCFFAIKTSSGSHVRLDPVWASLAMALSSISVVVSSLLLRSKIPGIGFTARRGVGGQTADS